MHYHSAMKRNKLLVLISWMVVHGIMLSGIKSQSQMVTYYMIPFTYIKHSQNGKAVAMETRLAVAREQGQVEDCECKRVAQESSFVVMEEFCSLTVIVIP